MSRLLPHLIVTIAGGAVMVLELVGSRVLAPWFGATTIIWTALIGIIMASLAAGYWWGGRAADRRPDYRVLTLVFAAASVSIAGIAFGKDLVLGFLSARIPDLRLGASVATIALFSLPSFLLASVVPFVIRVEIANLEQAGATVGRLNAGSTGGSIVGTFLAGFVLIASIGHFRILLGLSAVLLVVAGLCQLASPQRALRVPLLVLLAAVGALQWMPAPRIPGLVHDVDSPYARLLVIEAVDEASGRPIRAMLTDVDSAQAAVFLDDPDELVFAYTRAFRLVHHFRSEPRSLLAIGGGVGVVTRDFLARASRARVDLVEIDPTVIELGRRYFGLESDPRLHVVREDGRTFVRRDGPRYDAVVIDAFGTPGSVPHQLTTAEFVADLAGRMTEDGVVLVNVVSAITGERGLFLRAEVATYARSFPQVEIFQVDPAAPPGENQNVLLVASRSERPLRLESADPELDAFLRGHYAGALEPVPALTDDFAPVDHYFRRAVF